MPAIPTIALIGRTNVGKSTLFNKLIEEQKSLVSDIAGTTRDRFEADCLWRGKVVRLVDTGGLDVDPNDPIERGVIEQSEMAIAQADVIMFWSTFPLGPYRRRHRDCKETSCKRQACYCRRQQSRQTQSCA